MRPRALTGSGVPAHARSAVNHHILHHCMSLNKQPVQARGMNMTSKMIPNVSPCGGADTRAAASQRASAICPGVISSFTSCLPAPGLGTTHMAPERLIHKKWPPQPPDGRQRIHQGCVRGPEKPDDRSRGGCAGMSSTRRASRALTRTSRGRRGTMSPPVLTRHRSWSGSPGHPRCWTAG